MSKYLHIQQESHTTEHWIVAQDAVLFLKAVVEAEQQQWSGDDQSPVAPGRQESETDADDYQSDQGRHDERTNPVEKIH